MGFGKTDLFLRYTLKNYYHQIKINNTDYEPKYVYVSQYI